MAIPAEGYVEHDFDVQKWAAPEFLQKASTEELLEEEWKKRSMAKVPQPTTLEEAMTLRLR